MKKRIDLVQPRKRCALVFPTKRSTFLALLELSRIFRVIVLSLLCRNTFAYYTVKTISLSIRNYEKSLVSSGSLSLGKVRHNEDLFTNEKPLSMGFHLDVPRISALSKKKNMRNEKRLLIELEEQIDRFEDDPRSKEKIGGL